jgi:hypothetical protein
MESADELMATACSDTGLDDFGADSFRDGLSRLVTALQGEARLNEIGELALRHHVLGLLHQRLQVEDWYRRFPEIADEPIVAPLFGLGLPRTGSTALSNLLHEDPAARSLLWWEAARPCPPPGTVEGPDPRVDDARAELAMQDQFATRLSLLVPVSPTGPAECLELMALDFKSHVFQALARVPSYAEWLLHDADLAATYDYERRTLKLLQFRQRAKPWRLKCPAHIIFIEHLDQAFPDARFVMTHRDVGDVLVSVADLYREAMGLFSDNVDAAYLGAFNVEQWSIGMQRLLAFRDRGNQHRFHDIDFRAMQRDPLSSVRGLYAWLGEPVTDDFEVGMRTWWERNAEGRPLPDRATAAEFGIDLDDVRQRFAGYTERFVQRAGRTQRDGGVHR